ncbi:MAG: zincin-like metallopeptidase domain-containing protein [Nitrospinota bacterium]|nr:zincin-like metallopeptidase domain-containing protein [Nitrospinota bacterium]
MPNVYEIVTDKIINALENGVIPWRKPWRSGGPKNLISKKPYRGINVLLLGLGMDLRGFASPWFATFRQISQLGGTVKKGEKGTCVVFWKALDRDDVDETGDSVESDEKSGKQTPYVLRYYKVFNIDQTEGIPPEKIPQEEILEFNPVEEAEKIVRDYEDSPLILFEGNRASYNRILDLVRMPAKKSFEGVEEYYSTLFHELVHSTGHEKRLARLANTKANFGSEEYSCEELVAEMGSAFLCSSAGIENSSVLQNSAAYIANWLKALKDDRRLLLRASSQAQKAANYILGEIEKEASKSDEKAVVDAIG